MSKNLIPPNSRELKPCPFCGSDHVCLYRNEGSVRVWCYECFSRGADFDETPGRYRSYEAVDRAIEAWNKRA